MCTTSTRYPRLVYHIYYCIYQYTYYINTVYYIYWQFGKTALHWAAEWGREELVTALLDAGADIDQKDGNVRTISIPELCMY